MTFINADRAHETTTTVGTGTLSLDGAVASFRTFLAAIGEGNTCNFVIVEGSNFEISTGTVSSSTLTRDTVLQSTNGGSKISLTGTEADVFASFDASQMEGVEFAQTTDATPTEIVTIAVASGDVIVVEGTLYARKAASLDRAIIHYHTSASNIGGTTTVEALPNVAGTFDTAGSDIGFDATADDGNDEINLVFTGVAGETWDIELSFKTRTI